MDPYEQMNDVLTALAPACPEDTQHIIEAVRQSIMHPSSSLVSLTLFIARDKVKLGSDNALCLIYVLKALEAVRDQRLSQAHPFLMAAQRLVPHSPSSRSSVS